MQDRNGQVIEVGDVVNVPCVIVSFQASEEPGNVALETIEPMHPGIQKTPITLSAQQIERVFFDNCEGYTPEEPTTEEPKA